MRRKSFDEMNCSVAQALEVVGEWWTLLIVRDCLIGITRFDDFQERLGIARNVLTDRLDRLVRYGVLARVAYQDHPVRYDYCLTEKGQDLWLVVRALRQWGDRWEAPDGPPVISEHLACGHRGVELVPSCSACGEPLGSGSSRLLPGPGSARRPASVLAGTAAS